ncbi:MAG: S-methyl-5-thioribose kinase [Eubacteriales bacterium]|jgi:5-methylthioribose kinase|nr:S-methyl-5-thioribose kinase [Eubacteriales bacterium]NLV69379.1 S-methyl-5-thioribose kinase [Clostridiales bacterium]
MYTAESIIPYAVDRLPKFFSKDAKLVSEEIGDGNINYVYRIKDETSGKSLIVKHAENELRIYKARFVGTDRNRIEYEVLSFQRRLAPEYIPELYLYDDENKNIFMEDMQGYENMRYELCAHKIFQYAAEHLADFCAKVLINTTDTVVGAMDKKELVKRYINVYPCEITERHVLTEPYQDLEENGVCPANDAFMRKMIYENDALKARVGILKDRFQTKAQALIHGDLHTGSIFVTPERTCILDPEFAFYGPIGYDTGNFVANMIFAYANARVTMEDGPEKTAYIDWILRTIESFTDRFVSKSLQILRNQSKDFMMQSEEFFALYIRDILEDTAGYAGTELIRRIVGSSGVRDIKSIPDESGKARAEMICLKAGIHFIMHPDRFTTGTAYTEYLRSL